MRSALTKNVKVLMDTRRSLSSKVTAKQLGQAPKLVVVSNKLPFLMAEKGGKFFRQYRVGGKFAAVSTALRDGNGLWIGWPGANFKQGSQIPQSNPDDTEPAAKLTPDMIVPVILGENLIDLYDQKSCNETIWPLFHSMPFRRAYSNDYWQGYVEANELYGEKVAEVLLNIPAAEKDNIVVWIHDYHLMLVSNTISKILRGKLKPKLAFCFHVPFPCWSIFRLFPEADWMLQGILGCTVDFKNMLVEHAERIIQVVAIPMGSSYETFVELAQKSEKKWTDDEQIIIGVDTLDPTRGIANKLRALDYFLEMFPQYINKIIYRQIVSPTRSDSKVYEEMKLELESIVEKINSKFKKGDWSPVEFIYGVRNRQEMALMYRDSNIALITPLQDGINLEAQEFVACQSEPYGVLILSSFTGSAETMKEALICNPYDDLTISKALHRALSMSKEERTIRMKLLQQREKRYNIRNWLDLSLKAIKDIDLELFTEKKSLKYITEEILSEESPAWDLNENVAILLDYDGTLAPIAPKPELALIPDKTRALLEKLSIMPNVTVAIVSGRLVEDVMKMVGLKNIIYSGSHGGSVIFPNGERHDEPVPKELLKKSQELVNELKQIKVEGAWVEEKGVHLQFHYRQAPEDKHKELYKISSEITLKHGFLPRKSRKAVQITPLLKWNKGTASMYILIKKFGLDWHNKISIFYVGDEDTDEDAFQVLKGLGHTVLVSKRQILRTFAEHRLPHTDSVFILLSWLEKYYSKQLQKNKT